jgi:hypothetical protein
VVFQRYLRDHRPVYRRYEALRGQMSKPPESDRSKAVSAIARAMMPPPPGETEKAELYQQAGRAVVELSNAENMLAVIFCILSVPVSVDDAKEMFSSQGGFEKRLKLVNFMVARSNHAEEMEVWSKIYTELNTHRGVRNLIAHQRVMMEMSADSPVVSVSLSPLFYKGKGKRVTTAEIKATADELESINKRLWQFVGSLGKPD